MHHKLLYSCKHGGKVLGLYGILLILLQLGFFSQGLTAIVSAEQSHGLSQSLESENTSPPGEMAEEEAKAPDQKLLFYLFKPIIDRFPPGKTRQDLGFKNFFTVGWNVGWEEPHEGPDDAPRFRLMKIQRAYWERELRGAYNYTFGASDGDEDEQEVEFELELPVNRRFLIEFEGGFVGVRPNSGSWRLRGGDLKIIPEVMLMETQDISFSSGLVIRIPTGGRSVGEGRSSLTPYLAFWKDLGMRIGLHNYLGVDTPLGGFESGSPHAILQYAVAPAITMTSKDTPYLGDLTFFVETDGETEVGGIDNKTTITLLPGMRWMILKDLWLASGFEFPVTNTKELDNRIWASIYRDF